MNSIWHYLVLILALVVSSCAGGMGTTGGSPLGTTEKGDDGEVFQGEIELQDQLSAPVPGMDQGPLPGAAPSQDPYPVMDPVASANPSNQLSSFGQGSSLAPGLEPPAGPTMATAPSGQIFGIPITAGGGTGSATPTDVVIDEEDESAGHVEPEISYHASTAAPAEEALPTLPSAPSLNPDPIVVCAPDTICYQEDPKSRDSPPCSYEELRDKDLSMDLLKAKGSLLAGVEEAVEVMGQIVSGDGRELHRQCLIEITQQSGWTRTIGTSHSGFFRILARRIDSQKVERNGEEKVVAELALQIFSTDDEPMPLGEPVTVTVEIPAPTRFEPIKPKPIQPNETKDNPPVIQTLRDQGKKGEKSTPTMTPIKVPSSSNIAPKKQPLKKK